MEKAAVADGRSFDVLLLDCYGHSCESLQFLNCFRAETDTVPPRVLLIEPPGSHALSDSEMNLPEIVDLWLPRPVRRAALRSALPRRHGDL